MKISTHEECVISRVAASCQHKIWRQAGGLARVCPPHELEMLGTNIGVGLVKVVMHWRLLSPNKLSLLHERIHLDPLKDNHRFIG